MLAPHEERSLHHYGIGVDHPFGSKALHTILCHEVHRIAVVVPACDIQSVVNDARWRSDCLSESLADELVTQDPAIDHACDDIERNEGNWWVVR